MISNPDVSQPLESKDHNMRVTRNLVHKLTAANAPVQTENVADEEKEAGGDQNYQFYKEYCRLYYANIILTNRLQSLLNEKQELQFKLNRLEVRPARIVW